MLNCTLGVECILHEHNNHHHHQHGHQTTHPAISQEQLETGPAPDEILEFSDGAQGLPNDTRNSELSSLSHLDAPNESLYMICGVLIAMLLVALIIVLLAVTISKLRKRGDPESDSTPATSASTVIAPMALLNNTSTGAVLAPVTVVQNSGCQREPPLSSLYQPHSLWHYPASHFLYATDQYTIITPLPSERPGFCRGVRKNLRGRWKRIVKSKSASESCVVSRDQLKQIYVY